MHERIAELSGTSIDPQVVKRLAAIGFDTVLVAEATIDRIASLRALDRRLAVWVVVSPDEAGLPLFVANAAPSIEPWMLDSEAALDPRRAPTSSRPGPIADSTVVADGWRSALEAAVVAGVSGFVCRDTERMSTPFWSALIDSVDARWIAWTPGLPPAEIARLVASGFDTICSSAAWWDGRGHWLAEEAARFPATQKLAFPLDPFAPSQVGPPMSTTQRLKIAALVGDALLVPQPVWSAIDCTAVNAWFASRGAASGPVRFLSGPGAALTVLAGSPRFDLRVSESISLLVVNPDGQRAASLAGATVTSVLTGFGDFDEALVDEAAETVAIDPCRPLALAAGAIRLFTASRLPMIELAVPSRRSAHAAVARPRLAIEAVTPSVEGGRFPVKRTAGDAVRVEADLLIDGHEQLAAAVLYRAVGEREWREVPMEPIVNDRYAATFPLRRVGRHEFTIVAWRDVFGSYRYELDKKSAAGLDVTLELIEGRRLVDARVLYGKTIKRSDVAKRLARLSNALANPVDGDRAVMAEQVAALLGSQTLADMQAADPRAFETRTDVAYPVDAEREAASFAAWYELFPRSLGNPAGAAATHHGTFDDVIGRLPAVRAMGFDVLYFPPIHPIGRRNRKGRNNALVAADDEPGSPYAIGSEEGGHDALHPQLGTFDDFKRLRDAAFENGLELALDFAIQCSPDHPWLKAHPGWFAWRPDGSLRYAENPPKKYEDIVNVEFYGEGEGADAAPALWTALRDVVLLWVEQGVRIFRVDNPHTKPLPFWEWMIGEVRAKYPDVIFLSEAFTRPKLMYRLAKIGFSQSYTYFTWRHTKVEFVDYLTELTTTAPRDFLRPHFFVNTPDINPVFLQRSGRPGFLIRAALAATLSGLWGIYSGFELCDATPVPGKEDYLDSEKYQLRAWDWQRPGNIVAEITALNRMRRDNPAMRSHLNVHFQNVFDPNILYFSKATADRSNIVLVAINLDPFGVHEADFEIPLWEWGLGDDAAVDATDLVDGHRFRWHGKVQRMRLDPAINPYSIWRVTL